MVARIRASALRDQSRIVREPCHAIARSIADVAQPLPRTTPGITQRTGGALRALVGF